MQSSSALNNTSFPKEQKVSDGIYITDFRKKSTPQSIPSLKEEYEGLLATTQCDLNELNNKIYHLERSNKEMKEMDPDGEDPDLVEAIDENNEVIERFKKQVELIKERLSQLEKKGNNTSKLSAKDLPTLGVIDDDITDEMLENLTL